MADEQLRLEGIPPAQPKHKRRRRHRAMGDGLHSLDVNNPKHRDPKLWPAAYAPKPFSRFVPIPEHEAWYRRMARKYLGR